MVAEGLVSFQVDCLGRNTWTAKTSTKLTGDHKSDFKAYSPLSSSHRVLSFDFRGHGQSSRTEPFTFHQLVEDIEGLRRHFLGDSQPCIICGGSFGGFLAQQYAITYPSKVSHLILRGTAPSHHRKYMENVGYRIKGS